LSGRGIFCAPPERIVLFRNWCPTTGHKIAQNDIKAGSF